MGKETNTTIEDWCTGNICLLDMSATKSNQETQEHNQQTKQTLTDYDAISSLLLLPIPQKTESFRKPTPSLHSSLSSFSTSSTSSGSVELRLSRQTRSSLGSFHNRSSHTTESVPIPEVESEHVQQAKALCHTLINTHQSAIAFGPQSEQVLSAQGVKIYSTESLHSGNQRLELKRYTAHFELAASIQELASFLIPTEASQDRVQQCNDILFPGVYGTTTLWTGPVSATSQTRIQWKAERMSTLFTRDRDLVVLEHHQTFPLNNGTNGLVHLLHSVDAPGYDPSLAHRANKRYVRGSLHTSGLVATEVLGNRRVLQVSITLDMDLHDTSSSSQQKVAMVKRLQQWVEIRNLVWKSQMVQESNLFAHQFERQAMTVGETLSPCEVCTELLAQTKWCTTHTLDGTVPNAKTLCMCCERLLCGGSECTRITEFPSFLVQEDLQRSGKKWKLKSNTRRTIDCTAKLCTLCVKEYRTPEC